MLWARFSAAHRFARRTADTCSESSSAVHGKVARQTRQCDDRTAQSKRTKFSPQTALYRPCFSNSTSALLHFRNLRLSLYYYFRCGYHRFYDYQNAELFFSRSCYRIFDVSFSRFRNARILDSLRHAHPSRRFSGRTHRGVLHEGLFVYRNDCSNLYLRAVCSFCRRLSPYRIRKNAIDGSDFFCSVSHRLLCGDGAAVRTAVQSVA